MQKKIKDHGLKTSYFECDCTSCQHTLRFTYDRECDDLVIETYLSQYHGVMSRIFLAIKYVLGISSRCGHWDCVLISKKRLTTFQKYVKRIRS